MARRGDPVFLKGSKERGIYWDWNEKPLVSFKQGSEVIRSVVTHRHTYTHTHYNVRVSEIFRCQRVGDSNSPKLIWVLFISPRKAPNSVLWFIARNLI